MTEEEWAACTDPQRMFRWIKNGTSKRKLRLFASGTCRLLQDSLPHELCRKAIDVAERMADGVVDEKERQIVWQEASNRHEESVELAQNVVGGWAEMLHDQSNSAFSAMVAVADKDALVSLLEQTFWSPWLKSPLRETRCDLLRDLFGNPIRPIHTDLFVPLREETVVTIAQVIDDERRFEDLPILADALEEAGCTEQTILLHCREATRHVRGCWLLDSLLGKS